MCFTPKKTQKVGSSRYQVPLPCRERGAMNMGEAVLEAEADRAIAWNSPGLCTEC